jgi:hypothetical protein
VIPYIRLRYICLRYSAVSLEKSQPTSQPNQRVENLSRIAAGRGDHYGGSETVGRMKAPSYIPDFTPEQWLALAVAGFVIYNTTVIGWELNKPGSRVCFKCAATRMILGAGLAVYAVTDAFSGDS